MANTVPLSRLGAIVPLVMAAVLVVGCDTFYGLRVRNESDSLFLTRTTLVTWGHEAETAVYVEEVPPGADGFVDKGVGSYRAGSRIELLREDCSVVESWPLPASGAQLIIRASGTGDLFPSIYDTARETESPETAPPFPWGDSPSPTGRPFRSVMRCEATDTVRPEP